jgi:hypothetical protein
VLVSSKQGPCGTVVVVAVAVDALCVAAVWSRWGFKRFKFDQCFGEFSLCSGEMTTQLVEQGNHEGNVDSDLNFKAGKCKGEVIVDTTDL